MKMLKSRSKGVINVETEANVAYSATGLIILPPDSPELEKEETPETDANIAYGEITDANIVVDEGTHGTDYEAIEDARETDVNMTHDEDKPETVVNISYNVIH